MNTLEPCGDPSGRSIFGSLLIPHLERYDFREIIGAKADENLGFLWETSGKFIYWIFENEYDWDLSHTEHVDTYILAEKLRSSALLKS